MRATSLLSFNAVTRSGKPGCSSRMSPLRRLNSIWKVTHGSAVLMRREGHRITDMYTYIHLQFPLSVSRLMLTPTSPYGCETLTGGVLVRREHCCVVYGRHGMPAAEKRQLLAAYEGFVLLPLREVRLPKPDHAAQLLKPVKVQTFLCKR